MTRPLPTLVARFLLVEARDWLFAILAVVGAILIPGWTGDNVLLCTLALLAFAAAYFAALFCSRRFFSEEGDANDSEGSS